MANGSLFIRWQAGSSALPIPSISNSVQSTSSHDLVSGRVHGDLGIVDVPVVDHPVPSTLKIAYSLKICVLESLGAEKLGSNAVVTGPGRYGKVDKWRKKSNKFAGRISATLNRYDPQTK